MQHPARGAGIVSAAKSGAIRAGAKRSVATPVLALLVVLVIAAAIAAAAPPPAAATMVTETYSPLSSLDSLGQPDIDGTHVVYAGKNGAGVWKVGWGIMDTSTNVILPWPSPLRPVTQTHPAVSGDWIVWQEKNSSGDWDIAGRQFSAPGGDVKICQAPGNQMMPRISGNVVVWQDHRGATWDIYAQNVSSIVPGGVPLVKAAGDQTAPDVDASRVVWVDTRSGNADIWTLDPGPLTKRALVTNHARQDQPTISGHRVVWRDYRRASTNGTDLYLHDLTSSTTSLLVGSLGNQSAPRLSDDMLVYDDFRQAAFGRRSYGSDIGFFDITLAEDFDIIAARGDQMDPAIFGGTVLWADGGVPASMADSLHAAELTPWSAFVGINGYSRWTNDPVCTLSLYAAYKLSEVPQTITQMTVNNVSAIGPFPLEPYVESKASWDLNAGLADTDGLKQVQVVYRDAGADVSPAAIGEITLDRDPPWVASASPATCRSGGTATIKYRVDDSLTPRVRVTILIRNKANTKTLKTLACGWQTDTVKTRSFACTLSPGSYHFKFQLRDLAGNVASPATLYDLKVTK